MDKQKIKQFTLSDTSNSQIDLENTGSVTQSGSENTPEDNSDQVQQEVETGPNGYSHNNDDRQIKNRPLPPAGTIQLNPQIDGKAKRVTRHNRPEYKVGFYTRTAFNLMTSEQKRKEGGRQSLRMGLQGFDKKVTSIFFGARDDNPVADTVLYMIEDLVNLANNEIDILIRDLQKQMEHFFTQHNAGITYDQEFAYVYVASWKNRLTYRVMWLIQTADKFFNLVEIAQATDIISEKTASNNVHQVRRTLLNILHFANRYKHSNITRSDIAHGTQIARQYLEEVGDKLLLKSEVLLMKVRAETAPIIEKRPRGDIADLYDKLLPICKALGEQEMQISQSPKGRVSNSNQF